MHIPGRNKPHHCTARFDGFVSERKPVDEFNQKLRRTVVDRAGERDPLGQLHGLALVQRLLGILKPKEPPAGLGHTDETLRPGGIKVLAFIDHECVEGVGKPGAERNEFARERIEGTLLAEVDGRPARLRECKPRQFMKGDDSRRVWRQPLHRISQRSVEADIDRGQARIMGLLQCLQRKLRFARARSALHTKPPWAH